jgi:hypothetical protein
VERQSIEGVGRCSTAPRPSVVGRCERSTCGRCCGVIARRSPRIYCCDPDAPRPSVTAAAAVLSAADAPWPASAEAPLVVAVRVTVLTGSVADPVAAGLIAAAGAALGGRVALPVC